MKAQKETAVKALKVFMQGKVRAAGARLITATVLTAAATLLVACGGGGGSSAPATAVTSSVVAVTPPPTLALQSVTPAGGALNVPTTYSVVFLFTYTNAGSFTTDFKTTCNSTADLTSSIGVARAEDANNATRTAIITVTASGMPNNTVCTIAATKVQATGPGGVSAGIPASTSFTTFTTVAATPVAWYRRCYWAFRLL